MAKIFALFYALILGGCAYFSPSYQPPTVAIASSWSAKESSGSSPIESLPYLAWWQKFNDPQLNYYVESGLSNNLSIQLAKAHLEAAQGQLLTVKLNWIPFLSIFGGYIGGTTQNSLAPVGNLAALNNSGGFLAVLPAYTLNVFTNYALQQQASYNLAAAKNAQLSVRLAVIGQVAVAYFANLAQLQLIQQLKQLEADTAELAQITKQLDQLGLANQVSINQLVSKQQLIAGQLALAAKNLTASQNALRILVNQAPGSLSPVHSFVHLNPLQIIPGNLPLAVIAARPDVLTAEAQLKAANEGISVASSALLPSVNLNYFYAQGSGTQSLSSVAAPGGSSNSSNQQNYYAAYANWTISPSVFGQIDVNTASFKAALANYKYVVNSALHETDNALANNNAYNQKMEHDQQAFNALQDNLKLQQALYQRGLTSYVVILGLKLEQDLLALELTQTKLQQLVSLVNVYQSLGGGYSYAAESEE